MSGMGICCQVACRSPLTRNSKSGVVFSASNPSHKTFQIIPSREVALGFSSNQRRVAFRGASQRLNLFDGNGACGGNRLQFICALRVNDSSFGANKAPYARLLKFFWTSSLRAPYFSSSLAMAMDDAGTVLHLEEDENPVPNEKPRKKSGKQKRAEVVEALRSGRGPFDILKSTNEWSPPVFWGVVEYLHSHRRMHEALEVNL